MEIGDGTAIGMVETQGLVTAIEAADAMLKAADVRLIATEQTDPALITVQVAGEVAAVKAAVEAGKAAAERIGKVVATHVIPRPGDSVRQMLASGGAAEDTAPVSAAGSLDGLTVRELRARARAIPAFPLQGRAIARAGKQQLIALLQGNG